MSLDKAIKYGKEKRKEYHGSKKHSRSCRNNGGCPYCESNREHKHKKREPIEEKESSDLFQDILESLEELV